MEIANLSSLITTFELPSKIELWIPISLAKSTALLASNISKAVIDEGNAIFSDVEAKTSPRESLIITPTPAEPSLSKRAPSKLVLKILSGGGFQGFLAGRRLFTAGLLYLWNSCRFDRAYLGNLSRGKKSHQGGFYYADSKSTKPWQQIVQWT